ncbi:MAG: proline racemase family protein [Actinomycetota bacterium]|nr:proline racemase family protein [Actinomycetota bacterium]
MNPITAVDYHTGGEPFRIVTGGVPEIAGATVPDRRATAQRDDHIDVVRRLLCHEPRGHADMYGCFITPPNDAGADFGVLFWHKDGYSTACGHGTIALGAWAVDTGVVAADPDGTTDVTIDWPTGRVVARVTQVGGRTTGVSFHNVPSYVVARGVPLLTTRGQVVVDLAWGGALYASLRAADVGLTVTLADHHELTALGREVKWALNDSPYAQHPSDDRLSGVYGTILYDDLGDTADGPEQRNVTIYADGAVDRSPCGSGTASRVALLADEGRLGDHQRLVHHSIVGSTFVARVVEHTTDNGFAAVVPEVDGIAHRTGEHVFTLDPHDAIGTGFVLR